MRRTSGRPIIDAGARWIRADEGERMRGTSRGCAGLLVLALCAAAGCDDGGDAVDGAAADTAPVEDAAVDGPPIADGAPLDRGPAIDVSLVPDAAPPADPTRARVTAGWLRGVEDDGVVAFRGVPFAAPPVGPLRWRPPTPAEPWIGDRPADDWPSPCTQAARDTGEPFGAEDCLYLNVWRPVDAADAPVMVFIHGGGNMFGSTSETTSGVHTYEGARLARRTGAIVVTLQYRLNILGYLSDPAFDTADGPAGNWGLRDQIAGLQWVADDIAAFGGDPDRVLLFGESGGAGSVCGLVATPAAAGLFHAAIMQSGGCGGRPLADVRAWSDGVAAEVGCAEAADRGACLLAADASALARAASASQSPDSGVASVQAGPTIDGALLPMSPLAAMAAGVHNPMPLVFGVNAQETAWPFFGIVGAGQMWTPEAYEARVRALFGPLADPVLAEYAVGPDGYANEAAALIALTTDVQFVCPNRNYARAAAGGQEAPVYRFLYSHALAGGAVGLRLLGAFHGLELLFNFQHLEHLEDYAATDDDRILEAAFAHYWRGFAEDGAPGAFDGVSWPVYDPETDPYVELAVPLRTGEGLRTDRCDFWDALLGGSPAMAL